MKKNVLKKFAAAALAAATVMSSMSVMADAATGTEEKGSVTITKCESNTGAEETLLPEEYTGEAPTGNEYTLLQGVEFAYVEVGERVQVDTEEEKSSQTEIQYHVTNESFLTAIGIAQKADNNYTQTELNSAIKAKKNETITFVKENAEEANKKSTEAVSGAARFEDLSLHKLYVFAEINVSNAALASDAKKTVTVTKVSVPFLVSLPFTGKDGKTVTDLNVYPKNSTGTATIEKKIVENEIDKTTTNANIGDTINYKVTYSIPVGENGLESLVVTDTMSKGLTFDNSSNNIEVKNGDVVGGDNYTVDPKTDNNGITTITITFNKEYCNSLASGSTQNFTITYKATLNDQAVLGQSGNTNDVSVTYKNTGDVDRTTEPTGTPKVFTYGINLLKKGEGVDKDKLVGVEFTLTDENGEEVNVEKKDSKNYYTPGGSSNTVTTGEDGKIYIRGLKPGTYKLTETKTSNGYVLLKDPVEIVITPSTNKEDAAKGVVTATVGGKAVTMNEDSNNIASATAEVPLTVVNSKGFDLPATGGRGIALFTIAGIAIVAAAGSLLFMRKRSK